MTARFEYTAKILAPDYAMQALDIKTIALQMSENWAPSTRATITVPYTPAIDLLDPERADIYIEISASQYAGRSALLDELTPLYVGKTVDDMDPIYTGKIVDQVSDLYWTSYAGTAGYMAPAARTWLLVIRDLTINLVDNTVTLTCASPEARLQDWAHVSATEITPPVTYAPPPAARQPVALANWVLNLIGETLFDYDSFEDATYWTAAQLVMRPGVTAFDYIYQLLKKYGYLLYCRYDGRWVLRQARYYGESAPALSLNYSTNLKSLETNRSRDRDYYTAAVLTYRWTDSAGTSQTAIDAYDSGQLPKKVYTETVERPYPGAGVAQQVLATMQKTARTFKATAIADLTASWLSVAATVTLASETKTGYVQDIELQHPADDMTVTIRQGS